MEKLAHCSLRVGTCPEAEAYRTGGASLHENRSNATYVTAVTVLRSLPELLDFFVFLFRRTILAATMLLNLFGQANHSGSGAKGATAHLPKYSFPLWLKTRGHMER